MSRVSEAEDPLRAQPGGGEAAAGSLAQSAEPRPLESPWSQAQSSAQHLKHGTETPPPGPKIKATQALPAASQRPGPLEACAVSRQLRQGEEMSSEHPLPGVRKAFLISVSAFHLC